VNVVVVRIGRGDDKILIGATADPDRVAGVGHGLSLHNGGERCGDGSGVGVVAGGRNKIFRGDRGLREESTENQQANGQGELLEPAEGDEVHEVS